MNNEEGFKSLTEVLNSYPNSYQQGEFPTVVILDSEVYSIAVSMAIHPFSNEHRVLVLELVFHALPSFVLNFSTRRKIKQLNKKIAGARGFTVNVRQENGKQQCAISKPYYSPITMDELEKDRAEIATLAMVTFDALGRA